MASAPSRGAALATVKEATGSAQEAETQMEGDKPQSPAADQSASKTAAPAEQKGEIKDATKAMREKMHEEAKRERESARGRTRSSTAEMRTGSSESAKDGEDSGVTEACAIERCGTAVDRIKGGMLLNKDVLVADDTNEIGKTFRIDAEKEENTVAFVIIVHGPEGAHKQRADEALRAKLRKAVGDVGDETYGAAEEVISGVERFPMMHADAHWSKDGANSVVHASATFKLSKEQAAKMKGTTSWYSSTNTSFETVGATGEKRKIGKQTAMAVTIERVDDCPHPTIRLVLKSDMSTRDVVDHIKAGGYLAEPENAVFARRSVDIIDIQVSTEEHNLVSNEWYEVMPVAEAFEKQCLAMLNLSSESPGDQNIMITKDHILSRAEIHDLLKKCPKAEIWEESLSSSTPLWRGTRAMIELKCAKAVCTDKAGWRCDIRSGSLSMPRLVKAHGIAQFGDRHDRKNANEVTDANFVMGTVKNSKFFPKLRERANGKMTNRLLAWNNKRMHVKVPKKRWPAQVSHDKQAEAHARKLRQQRKLRRKRADEAASAPTAEKVVRTRQAAAAGSHQQRQRKSRRVSDQQRARRPQQIQWTQSSNGIGTQIRLAQDQRKRTQLQQPSASASAAPPSVAGAADNRGGGHGSWLQGPPATTGLVVATARSKASAEREEASRAVEKLREEEEIKRAVQKTLEDATTRQARKGAAEPQAAGQTDLVSRMAEIERSLDRRAQAHAKAIEELTTRMEEQNEAALAKMRQDTSSQLNEYRYQCMQALEGIAAKSAASTEQTMRSMLENMDRRQAAGMKDLQAMVTGDMREMLSEVLRASTRPSRERSGSESGRSSPEALTSVFTATNLSWDDSCSKA